MATSLLSQDSTKNGQMRALDVAEIELVNGGSLNCFPIFGDDGKMYSPTLDGLPGGALRDLSGLIRITFGRTF